MKEEALTENEKEAGKSVCENKRGNIYGVFVRWRCLIPARLDIVLTRMPICQTQSCANVVVFLFFFFLISKNFRIALSVAQ